MKQFKIMALINLKPVTVISDCTEEGTQLIDFYEHEEANFKTAIYYGFPVRIGRGASGFEETPSYDTPLGIVAAIYAVCPSNTIFLRAPAEIMKKLGSEAGDLRAGGLPKNVSR